MYGPRMLVLSCDVCVLTDFTAPSTSLRNNGANAATPIIAEPLNAAPNAAPREAPAAATALSDPNELIIAPYMFDTAIAARAAFHATAISNTRPA